MILYVDSKFTSPYAMSVFVALHEKNLSFEMVQVDLAEGVARKDDFKKCSLTNRVPTFIHNGFALSESSAITEYLEETYPEINLYPKDIKDRARARQVQAWIRSDLMPIRNERSTNVIFFGPSTVPLSNEAKMASEKLINIAEQLIPEGEKNLFGEWCLADTDLALMLNRLVKNGDPVPQRLIDYVNHQWNRSTVQMWVNLKRIKN